MKVTENTTKQETPAIPLRQAAYESSRNLEVNQSETFEGLNENDRMSVIYKLRSEYGKGRTYRTFFTNTLLTIIRTK